MTCRGTNGTGALIMTEIRTEKKRQHAGDKRDDWKEHPTQKKHSVKYPMFHEWASARTAKLTGLNTTNVPASAITGTTSSFSWMADSQLIRHTVPSEGANQRKSQQAGEINE